LLNIDNYGDNILLINDKIYGPSVGTPTGVIIDCLGTDKNLYTYIYDKSNKTKNIEGNRLFGVYPLFSSGWLINTTFQGIIFRRFKSYAKEKSKTSLIHYTSQQVKPFNLGNSTVTVHDLVPILFPNETSRTVYKMTQKNLMFYKKLPIVMTVSNFIRKSLIDNGFVGKIHVIYNPANRDFFPIEVPKNQLRKKLHLPEQKKLILSVSANYPRKNLKMIESTMDTLGNDYSLVRVGTPLKNSINFANISTKQLNELYNACDVFFIPSTYEGFGLPVLEAFSSGIPVVASDIEVFNEISKGSAILCSQDPKIYANAIKQAIDNRSGIRLKGLERAKLFSIENFCKQLKLFYGEAFSIYGIEA
jgi:glycosyltransferase involved in cell wall biosynthesis